MAGKKYTKIEAFVFKLWKREISGEKLSGKEEEALEIWKSYAEKDMDKGNIQQAKERVLQHLEPYFISNPKTRISFFRKYVYHSAAVLLLLLSLGGLFTYNLFIKPDVYTATLANRKITLEDGSVVTLLPGAQLTVEKSFPADTREVSLMGDAIFSVAKSKKHPFIVHADGFSTKVLGTVFKISQSGKDKSVDLYEGKVAVSYPGTQDSYLKPNQQWTNFGTQRTSAIITRKEAGISKKNTAVFNQDVLSLGFTDVSLREVIAVLGKSYNIEIEYPQELSDKKITADLTGEDYIGNVEAIAFILGLEVSVNGKHIELKK